MAKFVRQAVQDAPLDAIALATELYYCAGQPVSRADAIARKLHAAAVTMAPGDFAKSSSGGDRLLTVASKSTTGNAAGNADHVALCDGANLIYATTAPVQAVNIGGAVANSAFTIQASAIA